VDVIEFDVRAGRGDLVLAHTILDARRDGCLPLGAALAHLAGHGFDGIELNVDLKHVGCEAVLLEGLERHGLLERTLISSQVAGVLDRVREREPRARLAISVGGRVARVSRRWRDWRSAVLEGLAQKRWHALMAQHRLVDAALRVAVSERGAPLYAWTVNDVRGIARLARLRVDGVVTADPRLFGAARLDGALEELRQAV
jgi:glycerophosphoryl diester phosphodiesterase